VCTLTAENLAATVVRKTGEIAIVGTLNAENLGIERLILNVLANPVLACFPLVVFRQPDK
jgi:tetrahydromethanopterin S-methyltransferase subunit A